MNLELELIPLQGILTEALEKFGGLVHNLVKLFVQLFSKF